MGHSWGDTPKKVPGLGEEKGISAHGLTRKIQAMNPWENGGSLRATLVTWSSSPVPGLRRILGGPKSNLVLVQHPFRK